MTAPAIEQIEEALDPMEQTIAATLDQSKDLLTTGDEAEDQRLRDERTGRFVAQAEPVAQTEQTVPGETDQPAPVVIPDGYVAVQPLPDAKVQGFTVRDAEGEIAVPDLTWNINMRDGGPRELSTDQMVNFARMGVYNHQREQQVQYAQQEIHRVNGVNQQLVDYARRLEADREQMLTSDELYLAARAQYEQENTPQARMQRMEEQRRQEQQEQGIRTQQQQWAQYVDGPMLTAANTMLQTWPKVTEDELGAKLALLTTRFIQATPLGPIVPQSQIRNLATAIVQEIAPWAEQLHAHREHEQAKRPEPKVDPKAEAEKAAAEKAKLQKVRRQAAPNIRPTSGLVGKPQSQKPIRTSKDAEDAVIGNTKAAMGLTG